VDYSFESNDDIAMNIILSGSYTGTPSEFVYFINILLAGFIKNLYLWKVDINWFNLFFISFASTAIVFLNVLNYQQQKNNKIQLYFTSAVLFIILLLLLSSMNFSKFAALGIVSGIIPILFLRINTYQKVLAVSLMLIGVMIRFDLIYLVLLFLLPVVLVYYKQVIQNKSYLTLISITLACVFLNFIHQKSYNDNKQWSNQLKYNEIRSKVTVYDNNRFYLSAAKQYLSTVNWTDNDFNAISNFLWDLGLPKMEYEKLEFMSLKLNVFTLQSPYSMLLKSIDLVVYLLTFLLDSGMYLVILLLLTILLFSNNYKLLYLFIFGIFYVLFVLFFLNVFANINIYKDRIIWSAFLPIIVSVLIISFSNQTSIFKYNKILGVVLIVLCFFGLISKSNKEVFNTTKTNQISIADELNLIFDKPYVSWVGFDVNHIFTNPPNYSKAIMMGWFSGSPHNIKKIQDLCACNDVKGVYGIKNTEVNWVFFKGDKKIEMIKNFYLENFKVSYLKTSTLALRNGTELIQLSVLVNHSL
jgi:hypothetical protein